ncbi:MAG: serine--tRNA ligase, partial [Devosiaceae bacterium]|nr:serine--tRNA ligase [Devosiaceae bacterium]
VEMVAITTPDKSKAEHERMLAAAEGILKKLDIPFRTMVLCAGDTGYSMQKTYDIEAWLPGQNAYREISSVSIAGDWQARRMNARYRDENKKAQFVHTLNGSGVAVGRALVAVMENYQQEDGSITIPDVLVAYMGGIKSISATS